MDGESGAFGAAGALLGCCLASKRTDFGFITFGSNQSYVCLDWLQPLLPGTFSCSDFALDPVEGAFNRCRWELCTFNKSLIWSDLTREMKIELLMFKIFFGHVIIQYSYMYNCTCIWMYNYTYI